MSSNLNLKEVLDDLSSDKVRDREQAVSNIKTVFSRDSTVRKFDENGDGRPWLAVFQALFEAVLQNKSVCTKKGLDKAQPIAMRRLEDSAGVLRWLVERSVKRLTRRVVKPLMNHLQQVMIHHHQFFTPVALHYLKAVHAILSYSPHMDHLDPGIWLELMATCFAALLGDSVRPSDGFEEDGQMASDREAQDGSEEDDDDAPIRPLSKKRHRTTSPGPGLRASTSKSSNTPKFSSISLEQVECMRIIALLLSSPGAPYLSSEPPFTTFTQTVLAKFQRFFLSYPPDTSAHQYAISAINAILSQVEMNARAAVTQFGGKIWETFVSLWATKNKTMKEGILVSLRTLLPHITNQDSGLNMSEGLVKLIKLWDTDGKLGVDCLPLYVLRLDHASNKRHGVRPFEAKTFQSGFHFNGSHATSWAAFELLADCTIHLYILSESVHKNATPGRGGKRRRLENPFQALLHDSSHSQSPQTQLYRLQVLLFCIDRHWDEVDETMQSAIFEHLQNSTMTDPALESWTHMCLAAIAAQPQRHADTTLTLTSTTTTLTLDWEPIWKFAIRRSANPSVCRAASHLASSILIHKRITTQRILGDIEAYATDLILQGPSFPFDSVCTLLCKCLQIASQDARLYRLQFEDKVLAWLTETWSVVDGTTKGFNFRSRVEPHLVPDLLALLETICGLSKRCNVIATVPLPDCVTAYAMADQRKTAVIRDYLLSAIIPPLEPPPPSTSPSETSITAALEETSPRGRERRTSAFLLKSIESLSGQWESAKSVTEMAHVEQVRRTLDLIVLALVFESTLEVNGIKSNKRTIQAACRLLTLIAPCLSLSQWSAEERALILLGLEPLVQLSEPEVEDKWEVMCDPVVGTGIKRSQLARLVAGPDRRAATENAGRRQLLLKLWNSTDVQEAFTSVLAALRNMLTTMGSGEKSVDFAAASKDMDNEFAEIRTAPILPSTALSATSSLLSDQLNSASSIFSMCFTFISVAGMLQTQSFEPARERVLVDALLQCDGEAFLMLAPDFFRAVRRRYLHCSQAIMDGFLDRIGDLLQSYAFSRSAALQLLAIDFLDSTSGMWMDKSQQRGGVGQKVRQLYNWFGKMLSEKKIRSWTIRDRLARFLDLALLLDPQEELWKAGSQSNLHDEETQEDVEPEYFPATLLPIMSGDEDIRVRFRVALLAARLLLRGEALGLPYQDVYLPIRDQLTQDPTQIERMATRLLCLANIMVVSSAARRGPYWNLLEICFHSSLYGRHVDALLRAVGQRMGLTRFSQLFEAYSSTVAYQTQAASVEFFRIPASHLGYRDKRECAESSFHLISPVLILAGGSEGTGQTHGEKLFVSHCKLLSKKPSEGQRECFADIIGYTIAFFVDDAVDPMNPAAKMSTANSEHLYTIVSNKVRECGWDGDPRIVLHEHVDRILVAILVLGHDTDFSPDGAIARALQQQAGVEPMQTFLYLMKYRRAEDFEMHSPNLPGMSTITVLRSIHWLATRVPEVNNAATTYHVIQQLFARVGLQPLINEQMRLLHSLCIWVACQQGMCKGVTLLRTLMRGTAILLAQSDLARIAQSILTWCFDNYVETPSLTEFFPEMFGRIARVSWEHLSDGGDDFSTNLARDLLDWIEKQAYSLLSRGDRVHSQILTALALWPREPGGNLDAVVADLHADNVFSILENRHLSSGRFRIVRRLLQAIADDPDSDPMLYAQNHFWWLKNWIPPTEQLQYEDVDAFIALLSLHHGQLQALVQEETESTVGGQHQKLSVKNKHFRRVSPRRAIIMSLFLLTSSDRIATVHVAYSTLRTLLPILASQPDGAVWSKDFQEEMDFLGACPLPPTTRPTRNFEDLPKFPHFLEDAGQFDKWISSISLFFSDCLSQQDLFYAQLSPVLTSEIEFASQMLPTLVHEILLQGVDQGSTNHRVLISQFFRDLLSRNGVSTLCIKSIVDVVLHLRHFIPSSPSRTVTVDPLAADGWLDLDYRLLSRAAITCGAYTTALLFLELAAEFEDANSTRAAARATEEIMYEIYQHIEEPDGFYGIQSEDVERFLVRRFHHEMQWDKAFQFHGARHETGSGHEGGDGILTALHAFGYDKLAMGVLRSEQIAGTTMPMEYHLGWRTETWDLPEGHSKPGGTLYEALRAIHRDRDPGSVDLALRHTTFQEMEKLRKLGSEDMVQIRTTTQTLMCLGEIRKWRQLGMYRNRDLRSPTWSQFTSLSSEFDFADLEPLIATRLSLIRSLKQREQRNQIGIGKTPFSLHLSQVEKRCLVQLSDAARAAGRSQIALNSVLQARQLDTPSTAEVAQEFASVLWLHKEQKMAVETLQSILPQAQQQPFDLPNSETAGLLARLGEWISEACLLQPRDIQHQFFDPAVALAAEAEATGQEQYVHVFHQTAVFAEHQYKAVLRSPDMARLKEYMVRKQLQLSQIEDQLRGASGQRKELEKHQTQALSVLAQDQSQYESHERTRDTFLGQAIRMYARCLQVCDKYDEDVHVRLCSLWFANFDNAECVTAVEETFTSIPSHKFVFLAHQLSARLNNVESRSQTVLEHLILRMCNDHPFHSIYQVFALQADSASPPTNRRTSSRSMDVVEITARAHAATKILAQLRRSAGKDKVRDVERVCQASLEWAKFPLKKDANPSVYNPRLIPPFSVPATLQIASLQNVMVPVVTSDTPLDPTLQYADIVHIQRYSAKFTVAGGVNLPKICQCVGSDGVRYKQLFKGEGGDDLRQDAVMEQVFQLVNSVLRRDRETKKRQLSIRDYKVIPLASQAGILEFVMETTPLKNILEQVHPRYYPQDLTPSQCTTSLRQTRDGLTKNSKRRDTFSQAELTEAMLNQFLAIRQRFHPAFRHYFRERHKLPMAWFAMRLKYTRSTATCSIVGHILGLGDRHVSNILIDQKSGEMVQIDLGIAFDQGKLLPIPETVPFRLTADLLDGMGVSGAEGVFRRCAEETLRVLRKGSDIITTVLEVFRHDPLHSWTASAIKIHRAQGGDDSGVIRIGDLSEESADRALASVARKLDNSLSVEYTVNDLIAEATDPRNLAMIYSGWSPHL